MITIFRQSDADKVADANKTIKDLVPDRHGQVDYDFMDFVLFVFFLNLIYEKTD